MPGTAQGLTQGEPPVDAFEAALESKGIEGGGRSGSLSVSESIVEASKPESAPAGSSDQTAGTETTTEEQTPLHADPEIAALLEKHGGDTEKALKEAAEAQKLIGKQGQELGELRKLNETVAELRGRLDAQTATPAPAPVILSGEHIDELAEQHGWFEVAKYAANNAPASVDQILKKWQQEDPVEAVRFDRQYQEWLAQQSSAKTGSDKDETAEYVANRKAEEFLEEVLTDVASSFEDYETFKTFIPAALEAVPKHLAAAITSPDRETKAEAVKDLYERAQRLAASEAGTKAVADAAAKAAKDKAAARTISGQGGTPAPPADPSGIKTRAEQEAEFKANILKADTTSVSDGLTYAKA